MSNRASVRREVRIAAPADDVWAVVGDLRDSEPPAHEPRLLLEAPV